MKIAKEKTVSFSGHRTDKIIQENGDVNLPNVIKSEAYKVVLSLCEKGYDTFLTGMAEGFDLISGEAVLKARQIHPHIRLIAVIPFQGQELSYSVEDKRRFKTLYENAAERVFYIRNLPQRCFL